jgi:diguanylate cyclase (GGDEF)-like protein
MAARAGGPGRAVAPIGRVLRPSRITTGVAKFISDQTPQVSATPGRSPKGELGDPRNVMESVEASPGHAAPVKEDPFRVLIVDDDPVSAALASRTLSRAGFACETAQDPTDAWKRLDPEVALVVLDVMLPGQSGLEFLRRMRVDPLLADIPVLLATAVTDPAVQFRGLGLGAQGIVAKPIDRQGLLREVQRILAPAPDTPPVSEPGHDPLAAHDPSPDRGIPSLDRGIASLFGSEENATGSSESTLRELLAERASMRDRLDAGYRLLRAILGLHQMVGAGLAPQRLARGILEHARSALDADAAVLWVPEGRELQPLAAVATPLPPAVSRDGDSLPARAARTWSTVGEETAGAHRHWVHFPLSVAGEGVGVLSLHLHAARAPSQTVSALYCAQAASALDASIRLNDAQSEASTDSLTGLLNRRGLEMRLESMLDRARRRGGELSLLFVDLDHFKEINDSHGHAHGDSLLRETATILQNQVRSEDVVARLGGDEFVVVLPGSDPSTARRIAERLRRRITGHASRNHSSRLSATIGLAHLGPETKTGAEIIRAADRAMLAGKTAGRDRITAAGPVPNEGATSAPAETPATRAALRTLLRSLAGRHPASASHSVAVAALSARIARRMGLERSGIREAARVGLLHDIGKLYLSPQILDSPDPLTAEQRAAVDLHTETGGDLVASIPELRHLADAVRATQEHFDGSGYPDGRAGEELAKSARIVAVADAYHAMAFDRPYREARDLDDIRAEFRRCRGTQFDPEVVDALLDMIAGA